MKCVRSDKNDHEYMQMCVYLLYYSQTLPILSKCYKYTIRKYNGLIHVKSCFT
jgi:hypothetical protein